MSKSERMVQIKQAAYLSLHSLVRTERTTNKGRSILQVQLGDGRRSVDIVATLGRKGDAYGSCRARSTGETARASESRGPDGWTKHAHDDWWAGWNACLVVDVYSTKNRASERKKIVRRPQANGCWVRIFNFA
jgi:hypothetical protein